MSDANLPRNSLASQVPLNVGLSVEETVEVHGSCTISLRVRGLSLSQALSSVP